MEAKSSTYIKKMPNEERPREKLSKNGADTLTNAELLAILLRNGTKQQSVLDLANELLTHREDGLMFITDCTVEELCEIKGIGIAKASQLLAAIELGKRIAIKPKENRVNINSPMEISKLFMEEMRYLKKEVFKVLLLNTKNQIIKIDEVSVGILNSALVHPREVFTNAIRKNASSIILIHNHPSGNPKPSKEDISLTERLIEAGKIIGINVLDHIIIGDGEFISLKEKAII